MDRNKSMGGHIRIVRVLGGVLGLLQLAYFMLAWLFPEPLLAGPVAMSFAPRGLAPGTVANLDPALRWTGAACSLPALLLLGLALVRLDRMLGACAQGRMFALRTVADMKGFIAAILAALLLTGIEPALRALVWRHGLGAPPVPHHMGVSSEELLLLLVCALFFVVASMMHEARRIAEENEGFV